MLRWLIFVPRLAAAVLKSRRILLLDNLALRHQLLVVSRNAKRARWTPLDRALWAWLSHAWSRGRNVLRLVQPDTVIHWHRRGFRLFWKWESRTRQAGRKSVAQDTISLIRNMSWANPRWGVPRIHGELINLGITVAQQTVGKYLLRQPARSSTQNWITFLCNHLGQMVSVDFRTGPTLRFQVLYVFVVLPHQRRKMLHFNVVDRPSARWTAQQWREASAFTSAPK